jgi:hypothetical protein
MIDQIARVVGDKREARHYARTRLLIRQAALDGKLKIRGRREIASGDQYRTAFTEVYTDVSPAYWANSVINVLATAAEFAEYYHTDPETVYAWGPKGIYEMNRYAGLRVNSDEVWQFWPLTT